VALPAQLLDNQQHATQFAQFTMAGCADLSTALQRVDDDAEDVAIESTYCTVSASNATDGRVATIVCSVQDFVSSVCQRIGLFFCNDTLDDDWMDSVLVLNGSELMGTLPLDEVLKQHGVELSGMDIPKVDVQWMPMLKQFDVGQEVSPTLFGARWKGACVRKLLFEATCM
jgi:hypothetical protein